MVGLGVRQINARYKLVLTATPIKNRLPDIFRLAWWATGARADAHARFPYPDSSTAREEFAGEFLISERNIKAGESVSSRYPVMLAGVECMAQGHSFNLCNNVILMCYSWAYDNFEQAINRVHRLNSLWDVNVYPIICEGSIDRKLEAMIQEKGDAAELVLDGHLLGEHQSEVNLAELLHIAQKEFSHTRQHTIDESSLEEDWPKLRLLLGRAMQSWHAGIGQMVKPDEIAAKESAHNHSNDSFENESVVDEIEQPTSDSSNDIIFQELPLWKQAFRPSRNSRMAAQKI